MEFLQKPDDNRGKKKIDKCVYVNLYNAFLESCRCFQIQVSLSFLILSGIVEIVVWVFVKVLFFDPRKAPPEQLNNL